MEWSLTIWIVMWALRISKYAVHCTSIWVVVQTQNVATEMSPGIDVADALHVNNTQSLQPSVQIAAQSDIVYAWWHPV